MTADQINLTTLESSLKSVKEENELLFRQLHQVQGELEQLYSKNRKLGTTHVAKSQGTDALGKSWVDDDLIDALSEIQHLRALLDVQKKIHRLESKSTLSSRVGNILIQGVDSPASLLSAPGKLGRIWRESGRREPPKSFGGKNFDKIIAVYGQGGFEAVEKLLSGNHAAPAIQANALTALARQLSNSRHPSAAAEAAGRAYALDPKPYRLKWLAFRLHEDGQVIEAEAMLDSLPSDVQFSDSESRQVGQLRAEARESRELEAKQKTRFSEKRSDIARKLSDLERQLDQNERLAADRGREIEALKHARSQFELNESEWLRQREDMANLIAGRDQEVETLTRVNAERGQEVETLTHAKAERDREVETLTDANVALELEKAALVAHRAETLAQIDGYAQQIETLKYLNDQSDVEKSVLLGQMSSTATLLAERDRTIETLTHVKGQLEFEKAGLAARGESLQGELATVTKSRDEQILLASQRQGELLQLARNEAAWEKEKFSLELRLRELEQQIGQITQAQGEQTQLVAQRIENLASALTERNDSFDGLLKKQADDLFQARKHLDGIVKGEIANSTKQIQALVGLQSYYATGDLPAVNGELHSWPISQDFALYLVELIELNEYDLVIEFGSGISTVIVAKALAKLAQRRLEKPATRFVSLDHLDQYYRQTQSRLTQVGLQDSVELVLAPLQAWPAPNGNTYPYYSCEDTFDRLARSYAESGVRVLAIVDGPPASTGKHARYPALPLLLKHFARTHIDVLLDDYIRDDEKEVTKMWQVELQSAFRTCEVTRRKFEKDACLISTSPTINTGNA
ncbi:hypothetical protein PQR57_39350 [Paraburkholderia dipogonis]|uniref:Chromosome partition protein Smc n=1 Tax=Paraburkholderia dipogonis TaxID=1211383 RepID=A0ABW9B588_9BURK